MTILTSRVIEQYITDKMPLEDIEGTLTDMLNQDIHDFHTSFNCIDYEDAIEERLKIRAYRQHLTDRTASTDLINMLCQEIIEVSRDASDNFQIWAWSIVAKKIINNTLPDPIAMMKKVKDDNLLSMSSKSCQMGSGECYLNDIMHLSNEIEVLRRENKTIDKILKSFK